MSEIFSYRRYSNILGAQNELSAMYQYYSHFEIQNNPLLSTILLYQSEPAKIQI